MRDAAKYTHGKNQSLAESFNHEITNLVPKAQPVASMYTPRVHLAILNHNLGRKGATFAVQAAKASSVSASFEVAHSEVVEKAV